MTVNAAQELKVDNDLSHFSDTIFVNDLFNTLNVIFFLNPFKGTLAQNRLKSLILTSYKVLRNIY